MNDEHDDDMNTEEDVEQREVAESERLREMQHNLEKAEGDNDEEG